MAATPNATTTGCGSPTFAPMAGDTSVAFSGGTIAANGTCTVTVDVKGTTRGLKANTTSAVTSTESGRGGTASASLLVAPPTDTPTQRRPTRRQRPPTERRPCTPTTRDSDPDATATDTADTTPTATATDTATMTPTATPTATATNHRHTATPTTTPTQRRRTRRP